MEEYIYLELLVEDESGKILIDEIMKKYKVNRENMQYRIHGFKGIGRIPLKNSKISSVKSHRLLNDLPNYLKGINKTIIDMPGKKAIFVILDNDDNDCFALKNSLVDYCNSLNLSVPVFFCIAIEEIEAWLLGDREALNEAYPNVKQQVIKNYKQDSIIGTWEILADAVYNGGVNKLKKEATSYYEIGKEKCKWAKEIGLHMNIRNNQSPSFLYFISKLDLVCG
ncbi:MAG: DUF4276 family protein [Lachnospiraceae bacterium]|jgi:hypothetical protein|nr:DUF4276 family protein [Lachnospiraceae bacterium]